MADNDSCPKCGTPTVPREQGGDEDDRVCFKGCPQE